VAFLLVWLMLLKPPTCQRVNARTRSPNIDVNPNTSHCTSHNKAPPPPPPPRTAHCTYHLTAGYKALLQCASDPTMAPTLYPRGTVKKIVKAHSNRQMSKNVDILVRLMDTGEPTRDGKPCKSTRLTCNTDLPQLCVVYARVRTNHLTLFHYAMATRHASLALRYAM
jgi:hypothetical protein